MSLLENETVEKVVAIIFLLVLIIMGYLFWESLAVILNIPGPIDIWNYLLEIFEDLLRSFGGLFSSKEELNNV